MLSPAPLLQQTRTPSPVAQSVTARVAASPMFWGALSTSLSVAGLAIFAFGDLHTASLVLFCALMGAGWVAACIGRMVDPYPRGNRNGSGGGGGGAGAGWLWGDGDDGGGE